MDYSTRSSMKKKLKKFMSKFEITKKSIDYSTRKLEKLRFFLLWGTFDL